MNTKIIPIILTLIFIISLFSGCIYATKEELEKLKHSPVVTLKQNLYNLDKGHYYLLGMWSPYCLTVGSGFFVIDEEYHDNWEDYKYRLSSGARKFENILTFRVQGSEFDPWGEEFHCRAVLNCFDFWGPFRHFEQGYYQGEDIFVDLFPSDI